MNTATKRSSPAASLAKFRNRTRIAAIDTSPVVLADIYQDDVNMAVWQRVLDPSLTAATDAFFQTQSAFTTSMTVSPADAHVELANAFGNSPLGALTDDVAELVDMFCALFEIKRAGLRLATLHQAMCPRFHVDRVPCRLVTTYHGAATEWLRNDGVTRSKLGHGSNGLPDDQSGLFADTHQIQSLSRGDVALLKGEHWIGNENAGLIHRSPAVADGDHRLLLTLDFSE